MIVTLNLKGSVRLCAQELCVEGLAVHRGLMPAISRAMCRGLENASYRFTCAFCAREYSYCKSKNSNSSSNKHGEKNRNEHNSDMRAECCHMLQAGDVELRRAGQQEATDTNLE